MPAPTALGPANEATGRADGATDGLAGVILSLLYLLSKHSNASLAEVPGSAAGLFHLFDYGVPFARDHSGSICTPKTMCPTTRHATQPNSLSVCQSSPPSPLTRILTFGARLLTACLIPFSLLGTLIHRHGVLKQSKS